MINDTPTFFVDAGIIFLGKCIGHPDGKIEITTTEATAHWEQHGNTCRGPVIATHATLTTVACLITSLITSKKRDGNMWFASGEGGLSMQGSTAPTRPRIGETGATTTTTLNFSLGRERTNVCRLRRYEWHLLDERQ